MSKIYFTSDTHYNHYNIINYCNRPFESVFQMNETMIDRWNRVVNNEDTVYHLGDFAMGNKIFVPQIVERLQGKIILIAGNHDSNYVKKYFEEHPKHEIHKKLYIDYNGKSIELIHNPYHAAGGVDYIFCGHVHNSWSTKNKGIMIEGYNAKEDHDESVKAVADFYNVGVDVRNFEPVIFEKIIENN